MWARMRLSRSIMLVMAGCNIGVDAPERVTENTAFFGAAVAYLLRAPSSRLGMRRLPNSENSPVALPQLYNAEVSVIISKIRY